MSSSVVRFLSSALLATSALAAHGQFYKLHNVDLGVSAISPFTKSLTNDSNSVQETTDTTGFLFTMREHPFAWAGVEFNYGYSKYSQVYVAPGATAQVKSYNHEATAAYLFHPHFRKLQPFVGVGGGAIDFDPAGGAVANQWRGAGLLEAGLDIPTKNPHLGFKVQGRSLFYRAPNFYNALVSSRAWVATVEPSAGVYFRF